MIRRAAMVTIGAAVFACLLCVDDVSPSASAIFAQAGAVIGRPLTPMSYAGVARRTSRRAAYYNCRPVYDAYGRLVRSC